MKRRGELILSKFDSSMHARLNDFSGTSDMYPVVVQGGGAEDVIATRMVGHKTSATPVKHGGLIGQGVIKIGIRVKTFSVEVAPL